MKYYKLINSKWVRANRYTQTEIKRTVKLYELIDGSMTLIGYGIY